MQFGNSLAGLSEGEPDIRSAEPAVWQSNNSLAGLSEGEPDIRSAELAVWQCSPDSPGGDTPCRTVSPELPVSGFGRGFLFPIKSIVKRYI